MAIVVISVVFWWDILHITLVWVWIRVAGFAAGSVSASVWTGGRELELELSLFQLESEEVCELPPDSFSLELLLAEELPPELLEDSDEFGLLGVELGVLLDSAGGSGSG